MNDFILFLGDDNRNKKYPVRVQLQLVVACIYGNQKPTIDGRRYPSVDGYSWQSKKQKQIKRRNQNNRSHQARYPPIYKQDILQDCRGDQ